jgi:hypothetical protein
MTCRFRTYSITRTAWLSRDTLFNSVGARRCASPRSKRPEERPPGAVPCLACHALDRPASFQELLCARGLLFTKVFGRCSASKPFKRMNQRASRDAQRRCQV